MGLEDDVKREFWQAAQRHPKALEAAVEGGAEVDTQELLMMAFDRINTLEAMVARLAREIDESA